MKNRKGVTLLIFPLLIVAILTLLLASFYLNEKSQLRETLNEVEHSGEEHSNSLLENSKQYKSDYWGFSVSYPEDYFVEEFPDGIIISSYDTNSKKWTYKPSRDEIYLKIDVSDSTKIRNWDNTNVIRTLKVAGEEHEIVKFETSSPAEGRYSYLAMNIIKNGLRYRFYIEQADSDIAQIAFDIISSTKFSPRKTYKSSTKPLTDGHSRFENRNWGFAFDYSNDWSFKDFQLWDAKLTTGDKSINITLLRNGNDPSREILDNILNKISCAADGAGGSIYCPVEQMEVEEFTNQYDSAGYRIKRRVVYEHGYPNIVQEEYSHMVFAFPLSIQQYYAVVIQPTDIFSEILNNDITDIANTFQYLSE